MVRMKSSDQNERPGRDVFAGYAVWFSACFCGNFMALLVKLDTRKSGKWSERAEMERIRRGRGYTGERTNGNGGQTFNKDGETIPVQ